MNKLMFLMALLMPMGAQAECVPYSIPTAGTTIACPDGYAGVQFKTTTKSCPSGEIINGTAYNTSGCVAIVGSAGSQTVDGKSYTPPTSGCDPYTIPTPGTAIPCDGAPGVKYKTTTKVCPSGVITNSTTYNTSGCSLPTSTPTCSNTGITTNQNSSCATSGVAPGCPTGKMWSLAGTGIAHCVPIALPNCDTGIGDGSLVTCTTAGLSGYTGSAYRWKYFAYSGGGACTPVNAGGFDTSGCTPPPTPNCNTGIANGTSLACPAAGLAGYTGTAYNRVYTTYSGGGACVIVAAPGYNTAGCTAPPPPPPPPTPNCNTGIANGASLSCPAAGLAGYTGTAYNRVYTTLSGGGACNQVAAPGYNTTGCTAPLPPPPTPSCNTGIANGTSLSCPAAGLTGYTGTAYKQKYTTYSGGGACTTTAAPGYNTTGCVKPNCDSGITNGTSLSCPAAGLAGYTGTAYNQIYTTYSGGGACTVTAAPGYNTSGCTLPILFCTLPQVDLGGVCGCTNGATNPSCTLAPSIIGYKHVQKYQPNFCTVSTYALWSDATQTTNSSFILPVGAPVAMMPFAGTPGSCNPSIFSGPSGVVVCATTWGTCTWTDGTP